MTEPEQNTVIKVNIAERKAEERWKVEADKGVPRFLRDCAKYSKDNAVKSVLVMFADDQNHVHWIYSTESDLHKSLMCLALEDTRAEMKGDIFNEPEED